MSNLWQHPYVNIFKHFNLSKWKKSAKEGDVTTCMDKMAKCTVYRIAGVIPANNYIQLPKTGSQSLGLTGRYTYLAFKPIPERYFVMHLDVASTDGLVIRISFSNLFKEFKSTSTWLQFPFIVVPEHDTVEFRTSLLSQHMTPSAAPSTSRWTLLVLDLQYILSIYLNRSYSHVKTVRLCANTLVKGIYTSDNFYEPGVSLEQARKEGLADRGIHPLPAELSFPLKKSDNWHEKYDLVRFPSQGTEVSLPSKSSAVPPQSSSAKAKRSDISVKKGVSWPVTTQPITSWDNRTNSNSVTAHTKKSKEPISALPEVGIGENFGFYDNKENESREVHAVSGDPVARQSTKHSKSVRSKRNNLSSGGDRGSSQRVTFPLDPDTVQLSKAPYKSLQPDPILKLKKVIGFGGVTEREAIWTHDGSSIVYPCHSIVVALHVSTGRQRFFIGHTDKVSCISLTRDSSLLGTGQTGESCSVRMWNYKTGHCLSVFRVGAATSLHCMHFSESGSILSTAGKDSHKKTLISVWNSSRVLHGGEVNLVAKVHTEAEVTVLRVSPTDDRRLVSCGRNNLRLWRLKSNTLCSAAVPLMEHHLMEFTDICWSSQPILAGAKTSEPNSIYACSRSGHIFEVDERRMRISNVHRLLPHHKDGHTMSSGSGVSINSIYANDTFCVTGSSDGFLRVWPLDFKHVYLEAEHDGPVSVVQMSDDGLKILAATSTGNLGVLDVTTRKYQTLMRSHTDSILNISQDVFRRHMATVSADHTIRVWSQDNGQQLYDFNSPNECPTNICYHPSKQMFAVGFDQGCVRVFDILSTSLLADLHSHKGSVTGLAYTGDGSSLFSSAADGTLCLYDSSDDQYRVVRLLGGLVAKGNKYSPDALAVSPHGNFVAFVGPEAFTVTIVSASTLDEVMRIDITAVTSPIEAARGHIDTALRVYYTPVHTNHLIVTTENSRLLKFDASSGKLLAANGGIHREACTGLDISKSGKHLVTAGDRVLKVWDYQMRYDLNFQVFIGASERINKVCFSPSYNEIISCGEAIFIWQFFGSDATYESDREDDADISTHITGESTHFPRTLPSPPSTIPSSPSHRTPYKSPSRRSLDTSLSALPRRTPPQRLSSPNKDPILLSDLTPLCNIKSAGDRGGHSRLSEVQNNSRSGIEASPSQLNKSSLAQPSCQKHFIPTEKFSTFAQKRYVATEEQSGLRLKACIGYNGNGRDNIIWQPETGFFAYTNGCVIVIEDLKSGEQKHLTGHIEEISTLAVQGDCQEMASASGPLDGSSTSNSQLCIWNIPAMSCRKVIHEHTSNIVSLAYSRDDRFLISIGDHRERKVNLWETRTCALLSTTVTTQAIHYVAWDQQAFNEFITVGGGASVLFWLVDEITDKVPKLRVQEPKLPEDIVTSGSKLDFTCASYAGDGILYIGSDTGVVYAWNTRKNCCILNWNADSCEIGAVCARRNQLVTGSASKRGLKLWSLTGLAELLLPVSSQGGAAPAVQVEGEMSLDGFITAMCFDETLDMGIVGTDTGSIWYVNWQEHSCVRLVTSNPTNINALEFSNDSSKYVTCADDGSLRVWLVEDREQILEFNVADQRCLCAAFTPAATIRGVSGAEDRSYSSVDGKKLTYSVVAAGYQDGTLRVFDTNRAEMLLKVQPHRRAVTAVRYGSSSVLISGDTDGFIALTSSQTGMTLRIINDHKGAAIENIDIANWRQLSPSGRSCTCWLACGSDRRVSVWSADWEKDKCTLVDWLTFPAPIFDSECKKSFSQSFTKNTMLPPSIAQFSTCERDIIIYTGYAMTKAIQFYSLSNKSVIRSISLTQWVKCLHSTDSLIATGINERLVKIHDYHEGTFQDFIGHDDAVSHIRFSPDGKQLLSVVNKSVNLWDVSL